MRFENAFDPETAVRLYYDRPLGFTNADLAVLFDISSSDALHRVKNGIREIMKQTGKKAWGASRVNADAAFEYAGVTVAELEEALTRRKRFDAKMADLDSKVRKSRGDGLIADL